MDSELQAIIDEQRKQLSHLEAQLEADIKLGRKGFESSTRRQIEIVLQQIENLENSKGE